MTTATNISTSWKEAEYFRQYYHLTNVPILCECGCTVNKRQLCHHKKTKKHFYMLETVQKEARELAAEAETLGIKD